MTPPGAAGETDRQTQLLRGALDMCMLAMLAKQPAHGYDLVRRLNAAGLASVGYGTVYPLLTRMRRLGLVVDDVETSPTGPPRKVYALTREGQLRLAGWTQQWNSFVETVNATIADAEQSASSLRR